MSGVVLVACFDVRDVIVKWYHSERDCFMDRPWPLPLLDMVGKEVRDDLVCYLVVNLANGVCPRGTVVEPTRDERFIK